MPCDATEFETAQRRDALYAEAEAEAEGFSRSFWAEMVRIDVDTAPEMTPKLGSATRKASQLEPGRGVGPEAPAGPGASTPRFELPVNVPTLADVVGCAQVVRPRSTSTLRGRGRGSGGGEHGEPVQREHDQVGGAVQCGDAGTAERGETQ